MAIIKEVRIDWCNLITPGKQGKYGCTILLPKGSKQEKQVKDLIAKAKTAGVQANKFTEAQTKSATFKGCIRDGDGEIETEGRPNHYKSMSFINVNNAKQPGIVDKKLDPVMSGDQIYSGCVCNCDINIAPFYHAESGSRGIGAYLQNIMVVRDEARLDGRQAADEAFAGMEVEDDDNLQ